MKKPDKLQKETVEGILWGGFKGEHNLEHPYYVLPPKQDALTEDAVFVADILRKFARKRVRITVEEIA